MGRVDSVLDVEGEDPYVSDTLESNTSNRNYSFLSSFRCLRGKFKASQLPLYKYEQMRES